MSHLATRSQRSSMFPASLLPSSVPTGTGASVLMECDQPQSSYSVPPVVLLRFGIGIGTGGDQNLRNADGYCFVAFAAAPVAAPSVDPVVSPAEMLSAVREAFGLNIKQAAGVFNVERPTIYLWAALQDLDRVRPQNRARMKTLYRLAQEWKILGRLPNNALEAVLENSTSLIELLSAPELDVPAILACHAKLQAMRSRFAEHQRDRARALANALGHAVAAIGKKQAE